MELSLLPSQRKPIPIFKIISSGFEASKSTRLFIKTISFRNGGKSTHVKRYQSTSSAKILVPPCCKPSLARERRRHYWEAREVRRHSLNTSTIIPRLSCMVTVTNPDERYIDCDTSSDHKPCLALRIYSGYKGSSQHWQDWRATYGLNFADFPLFSSTLA